MKTYTFKNGQAVPALGFGTWKLLGEECQQAVASALSVGYRHIDTADTYKNHQFVGQAIAASGIKREDIFVTSKIGPENQNKTAVAPACERILKELGLDYLDLLLMHWPDRSIPFKETLGEIDELRQQGLIRSIGVSNFTINHLKDALATGVEFVNNQVEFHPSLNQKELKNFCDENHIIITAYSPLGRGADIELEVIKELAQKYGRPGSQIVLNWFLQKGMIVIPKSATLARIEENFNAAEFDLAPEDVSRIDQIVGHNRIVDSTKNSFADFDY